MKLYAFTTPEIAKHAGYLKIGETNGSVEQRIAQEGHELNVEKEIVWRNAVITERSHIDKMIHRYLAKQGFSIQQFDTTGQDTEWVKCTVADLEKAFAAVKEQLYQDEIQRQIICDKFYLEIRNWYYWTVKKDSDAESVLRLVVRLLFCFFLQDKGLVPKELFDEHFLKENLKANEEYRYYNAVLRNLFFFSLNTPQQQRQDLSHKKLAVNGTKIKKLFDSIPFLNGEIFTEHTGDDFAINDDYFFSEPRTRHLTELGGDYKVAGIIHILSKYQYKLSLDDLIDQAEYAETVDPEFIGKVFESLLGCIDAGSYESRRKITGSYYTPLEIVDYMVNQSLDAYLKSTDENDILRCKILDPACGSGAFPCCVMNTIMKRLDPDKNLSQQERYRKKLEILQKVIYGVDIQPMAVQITALRLFLSLIQEIVPDKKKDNYGIEPLPNLETKFVCANTLLGLPREKQERLELLIVKATVKMLQGTRSRHFMETSPQEKRHLREYDEALRKMLSVALEDAGDLSHKTALLLMQWNPYDQTKSAQFFAPQWMFGLEKFDIVIGNPPYVSAPTMVDTNPEGRKAIIASGRFTTLYQKWDLYVPFMELGLQFLTANGVFAMIVPYPLTNQTYAKRLRELIINQYNLIEIVDLNGTKVFENATVSNCIPIISQSPPGKSCYVSHINEQKQIIRTFRQPLSALVQGRKTAVWNLTTEQRNANRYPKMNVLGDFCYISVGMVLNADEKTARGEFSKDDLISKTADAVHCRKYIEAKDIERYRVKKVRYLEYNTERCPDKLRRPTFRKLYNSQKLMFNRLGNLMVFLDEKTRFLHSDSMFSAVLWKELKGVKNKSISASVKRYSRYSREKMEQLSVQVDLHYLLGLLNSRYASVLLSNLRGGDYHIYPEHLRNLPIPLASEKQQKSIISLVNQILAAKKENPAADTSVSEAKIDEFVYRLYGLTDEEIKMIEG
ncbi:MAG: N-6 DNA methylase [Planctomycetaceae bacterium]|jgi:type I restriction-modification system DNA methylase subunit|nr:N-6 DNA methylase [Planctomycetaceae bacterium]